VTRSGTAKLSRLGTLLPAADTIRSVWVNKWLAFRRGSRVLNPAFTTTGPDLFQYQWLSLTDYPAGP
jgi:hypothetical protein